MTSDRGDEVIGRAIAKLRRKHGFPELTPEEACVALDNVKRIVLPSERTDEIVAFAIGTRAERAAPTEKSRRHIAYTLPWGEDVNVFDIKKVEARQGNGRDRQVVIDIDNNGVDRLLYVPCGSHSHMLNLYYGIVAAIGLAEAELSRSVREDLHTENHPIYQREE